MALLKFQDESGAMQFVHCGPDRPEIIIGRVRTCNLVTTNITVSRRHASLNWENGAYVLRDLNSANGIFYNKQRVAQLVMKDGDSVLIGSLLVTFELEPADMKAPAAPAPAVLKPNTTPPSSAPVAKPQAAAPAAAAAKPAAPAAAPTPNVQPGRAVVQPQASAQVENATDTQVEQRPRAVPAAWKADWKPAAKSAVTAKPAVASKPAPAPLPQAPAPRPAVPTSGGDASSRVAELEKALALEKEDRLQYESALAVAQERYYEASERADRAEAALVDVQSELALVQDENMALADRADELERENADRIQEIDDLRREKTDNTALAGGFEQEALAGRAEIERLRADKGRLELELKSVKASIEQLREVAVSPAADELDAARRTIEDLKLTNKGYLKRISRLLEDQEKQAPAGVVVSPEATGLSDRLCEMAVDASDSAGVVRSMVSELKSMGVPAETASEIRSAVSEVVDVVAGIRKAADELRGRLRPPSMDQ